MNEEKVLRNFKDSQKFQFDSEEQLRDFIDDCVWIDASMNTLDQIVSNAKDGGYIRKSELQTLVDEAEGMYEKYSKYYDNSETMRRLYSALQALKKSHPEFKE